MNPEKRNYGSIPAGIAAIAGIGISRCAEPLSTSPVASQLNGLRAQLDSIENIVGQLIDSTRSILSGDPRHEPVCESPEPSLSCALEQDLYDIAGRLDSLNGLLSRTVRNIQL